MKTICVFHSRDIDGWMSAAIVKKWFEDRFQMMGLSKQIESKEDTIEFLGWDYGNKIPDLSDYDKVIMVDVAFPAKEMKEIHMNLTAKKGYIGKGKEKQPSDFIWIDHQLSAIKEIEKEYPFGDSVPISLPFGFRDAKFAACELTWQYFFSNEKMPEIVRLLGMYDSFRHRGTDEERKVLIFQYAARASLSNYEECYKALLSVKDSHIEGWLNSGQSIYNYLCTEARQTYKKAFPVEFNIGGSPGISKYKRFLCVNQERFNPINFGIDYHKDGYDGFACFWLKDGKWNWSLYNDNRKVDCSVIAKQYGGGGHFSAAGMVIDTKTLLRIIT